MNSLNVAIVEVEAVRSVVSTQRNNPFFQRRHNRNVLNPPIQFRNEVFWKQMVVCMCTSVQPSGPTSRLSQFAREQPFALDLVVCESNADLRSYAERTLREHGLRFGPKIAKQIVANLAWLRNGGWHTAETQFRAVLDLSLGSPPSTRIAAERKASNVLMGRSGALAGFGPKQARNLWQCLGVTQYEIPLDSRICNWMNALPASVQVVPKHLYTSVPYYEGTMTRIQEICSVAGVLPCLFDAAVFASADTDQWKEDDEVF
jgi:hypothetical protein